MENSQIQPNTVSESSSYYYYLLLLTYYLLPTTAATASYYVADFFPFFPFFFLIEEHAVSAFSPEAEVSNEAHQLLGGSWSHRIHLRHL